MRIPAEGGALVGGALVGGALEGGAPEVGSRRSVPEFGRPGVRPIWSAAVPKGRGRIIVAISRTLGPPLNSPKAPLNSSSGDLTPCRRGVNLAEQE